MTAVRLQSYQDTLGQEALRQLQTQPADDFLVCEVDFVGGEMRDSWKLDFKKITPEMLTNRECLKELERILLEARDRNFKAWNGEFTERLARVRH